MLQTYRALVSCNGPFLLTPAHLRCDSHLQFVLWLHPNFLSNRPSHPLPAQPNADRLMTSCLVGLLGPLFRTSFFKYKAVSSLSELEQYLAFVARRNHLHKKCNHIVRERSLSKRKATMSLRNLRLPETSTIMFGRPSLHRREGMMGSVMSRGSFCDQGSRAEQWLGRLDVSKVFGQPKNPETEMDTLETEQLSRKAKSHLQLSAFLLHSQKQSCIFGSLQHPPRHSHIQRSSILTRTQPQRPSTRFCPVRIKRTPTQPPELDRRGELTGNFLSLSEISEDPENEVGGSDLKRKQQTLLDIVEEF